MDASGSTNPWDEHAEGWDDDIAARAYASAAYETLDDALAARGLSVDQANVCDFGCGTGLLTERLVGHARSIDAVDTSEAMLARLSAKIDRGGWTSVHSSQSLPTTAGTHDIVVCSSVLGFVEDYPNAVVQLTRLLRPAGLFVQWDWERDDAEPDPHGLTRGEIHDALRAAGLEAVEVGTAFEVSISGQMMRPLMGTGRKP